MAEPVMVDDPNDDTLGLHARWAGCRVVCSKFYSTTLKPKTLMKTFMIMVKADDAELDHER